MKITKLFLVFCTYILTTSSLYASEIRTVDDYKNSEPILVPKTIPTDVELSVMESYKYQKSLDIMTQENYGCVVRQAALIYGVDPVAIMGSIIGEATYNVNMWDTWGERYLNMRKKWLDRFEGNDIALTTLLSEPAYTLCETTNSNNYDLWLCYDQQWRRDPRNTKRSNSIKWSFFNPLGSGYTYGLGQLGPDRALMVTDLVHENSGFDLLTPANPLQIYDHILNPQYSIHYVAANNLVAIRIYKELANFDISNNPGVVATLYNLGKEKYKANQKYNENIQSLKRGQGLVMPSSNKLGALINLKQGEIRNAYNSRVNTLSDSICRKHFAH